MATIYGTSASNIIAGTELDDFLYGYARGARALDIGNDTISGNKGNDFIDGAGGNDLLNGGEGDDVVRGGLGRTPSTAARIRTCSTVKAALT